MGKAEIEIIATSDQRTIMIDGDVLTLKADVLETLLLILENPGGEFTRQDLWNVAYPDGRPFDRVKCRALIGSLRNLRASDLPVVETLRLTGIQTIYYLSDDIVVVTPSETAAVDIVADQIQVEEDPADVARRELVRAKIALFRKFNFIGADYVSLRQLIRDIDIRPVHFERTVGRDWRHSSQYPLPVGIFLACVKSLDLKVSQAESRRLKAVIAEELAKLRG